MGAWFVCMQEQGGMLRAAVEDAGEIAEAWTCDADFAREKCWPAYDSLEM